ncbi:MAG: YcaO-like family protein, partial [Methanobacteriaceae archaeon]|nr:YcaO-like family protein [Methanobacteriaceae archaeon]
YERMKKINGHWFNESEKVIELESIKNRCSNSFKEDIETTMKQLAKCGLKDVFFVDLTREEVDVPVVRVIIPRMEVFSVDPERAGDRVCKII